MQLIMQTHWITDRPLAAHVPVPPPRQPTCHTTQHTMNTARYIVGRAAVHLINGIIPGLQPNCLAVLP